MKILVVGDFHGKFPVKLQRLAKGVDLIVSLGDYPKFTFKKIFFESCYKTDKELWDVVGKEKYKKVFLKDWSRGENVLKKLNSFDVPVFTIVGNYDNHVVEDSIDRKKVDLKHCKKIDWKWAAQDFFAKTIKKYSHIKRFDYRAVRVGGLVLIGAYGSSFPGKVKSKAYRKYRKKLDVLFRKYAKENRDGRVIFVTHNVPNDCKLDKIRDKNAPAVVRGKHYGSKLVRRIIDRYQPVLCVSGHMHENQGKCKIGKTVAVNTGAALDGKCVVVDFDEGKGRIKSIKFVK